MSSFHDEINGQEVHEVVSTPIYDGNAVESQAQKKHFTIPIPKASIFHYTTGQELPEYRILNVLSMGKVGTGKTSTIYCLVGRNNRGQTGWDDGNVFRRDTFKLSPAGTENPDQDQGLITINDVQGFRGNLKYDWPLLRETISKLHSEQPIDMVILCLSFVRFNQEDENILYLLREFTTPAFHRLIRVVITHAPEGLVNEESKAMIAEKLSFLGNSPEEVLAEKVTFVDLISPLSFPSHLVETQEAISNKWNVAQGRLTQQLLATNPEESIKPNEIMAKSYLHQFYLVYKREIFIASTIVIILCLLYFIVFSWLWSLEQKVLFNMCLNDLDSLAENNTILQEQITELAKKGNAPNLVVGAWNKAKSWFTWGSK